MTITLFVPCFVDLLFPKVAISVTRVLEKLGHKVDFHPGVACCGQPAFNAGYWPEARQVTQRALEAFVGSEAVVVPSGSCASMFRVFSPELFEHTALAEKAKALAAKTYEFSDFLVSQLGVTDLGARFPHKVCFHDGCHGLRELGKKLPPRQLLSQVRELELIEMTEAETCCGFGGAFSAKMPAISTAMAEVKCASAVDSGAEFIVSNDSSCLMQIQGVLDKQRLRPRTIHLAEVLDHS